MAKRNKKRYYRMLTILSGCIFVLSIVWLIVYRVRILKNEKMVSELLQSETLETEMIETDALEAVQNEINTENKETFIDMKDIDFEKLHDTNEDIYAWITVPGTKVDYPVLQNEMDNYYIDRNLDDSKGYPGCIYTNVCNAKDFTDDITVLYGHNMKDDSMFGSLHSFSSQEFFRDNREILVYTPEKCLRYEVFGAVKYSDIYIPIQYGVNSIELKNEFLNDLRIHADKYQNVSIMIEPEKMENGKVIVLSTCIKNENDKRFLVCGILKDEFYYQ